MLRPQLSPPRRRGAGFTFEVQQFLPKYFGGSSEVQTFSGSIVVGLDQLGEALRGDFRQIGLSRQHPSHPSDGVLDTAFLPGGVGIAEESLDIERMEFVVQGELSAIVESDGLSPLGWQRCEDLGYRLGDRRSALSGRSNRDQEARMTLVQGENRLAVNCKQHQVSFPMSRCSTIIHDFGAITDRASVRYERCRTTALATPPTTFRLRSREVVTPGKVTGTRQLCINEAIDSLM